MTCGGLLPKTPCGSTGGGSHIFPCCSVTWPAPTGGQQGQSAPEGWDRAGHLPSRLQDSWRWSDEGATPPCGQGKHLHASADSGLPGMSTTKKSKQHYILFRWSQTRFRKEGFGTAQARKAVRGQVMISLSLPWEDRKKREA